ncbi:MAG TPA: glycosyltransferase family A protein [Candidatus Binataceae bacterium]|nr:glycosyltransferase family A protein [Candidatus Binataceae bacterium]
MKFSLILATVGRVGELEVFLDSLARQNYPDFELLVVDQNSDDRIAPLIARYAGRFALLYLKSSPGLSRARNVALSRVTGDLVAFPDDDCVYPPYLLERVAGLLAARTDLGGVSGRCLTAEGTLRGRWAEAPALIGKYNIFGRCISFTMFLRRALTDRIGPFDETLGLGAPTPWLGAEDFDYLLRAAQAGKVLYDPRVEVYHPALTTTFDDRDRAKRYGNALGFGRFLAKHHYPLAFVTYYSGRYLAGAACNLAVGRIAKAYYRWATLVGNFEGWFAA